MSVSELETFYQQLNEENKTSINARQIASYLSAIKRPPLKTGAKVEDFQLPDKSGQQVSVITQSGKKQLIALFSSGCLYSVASIDLLQQLQNRHKGKVDIVTIWNDDTRDMWLNTYQEQKSKISWTNLWDEHEFASTYFNRTMWPMFFVLNENGELVQMLKGYTKATANKLNSLIE